MERFADHTAGVALDCVIQVFEDLNACDFYPSPTPTAEPTTTPTATLTQTPTPTNSIVCRTYLLGTPVAATFTYTDCGGTTQLVEVQWPFTGNVCAQEGSVSQTSGSGTITESGNC